MYMHMVAASAHPFGFGLWSSLTSIVGSFLSVFFIFTNLSGPLPKIVFSCKTVACVIGLLLGQIASGTRRSGFYKIALFLGEKREK